MYCTYLPNEFLKSFFRDEEKLQEKQGIDRPSIYYMTIGGGFKSCFICTLTIWGRFPF